MTRERGDVPLGMIHRVWANSLGGSDSIDVATMSSNVKGSRINHELGLYLSIPGHT